MSCQPQTEIILILHSSSEDLPSCLEAISQLQRPAGGYGLTLVDNGTDGKGTPHTGLDPMLAVMGDIPVRVLGCGRNLGFAAGVNLAARHTRADTLALLNPDTSVEPLWLTQLVEDLRSDESWAAVAAEQLPFGVERDPQTVRGIREVEWVSGAGCVIRASAFEGVGGFDEVLFCYLEDVELSLRFRAAGHRLGLSSRAWFRHSRLGRAPSRTECFYSYRNQLLLAARYLPWRRFLSYELTVLRKGLLPGTLGWTRQKAALDAWFDHLGWLPRYLRHRSRWPGAPQDGFLEFVPFS